MRPPICAVCGARFGPDEGGLVTFAPAPGDAAWFERAKKPGFVGHPPNLEWFCGAHVAAARDLAGGTRAEALGKLRS